MMVWDAEKRRFGIEHGGFISEILIDHDNAATIAAGDTLNTDPRISNLKKPTGVKDAFVIVGGGGSIDVTVGWEAIYIFPDLESLNGKQTESGSGQDGYIFGPFPAIDNSSIRITNDGGSQISVEVRILWR